jgi:glycosyltransferase involved in cell wall biosynthesis
VVFVGRLLPHKGINYLIEAAPTNLPVKIIGQPMNEPCLRELHALAEGKCVSFHHDYADEQIVQAYPKALCIVLPSVFRSVHGNETPVPELLGQTLLEGMACGIPAVCSNVASMPEIVEDGRSGFIVPPNDSAALREKLVWLNEHRDAARTMGRHARARVLEKFTWPRVVERCLEIYARS